MNPAIIFHKVRLEEGSSPFSTFLQGGCSVLVLGQEPARFFEVLTGKDPHGGTVYRREAMISLAGQAAARQNVQALLGSVGSRVHEALAVSGLGDLRQKAVSSLTPLHSAQLEFALAICSDAPVVVLSSALDLLDPWRHGEVLGWVRRWTDQGRAVITLSNRPSLCADFDEVLVLGRGSVLFHDTADYFRRSSLPVTYEVLAGNPSAALAIARNFQVDIQQTPSGFVFSAPDGQEIAAKLLTQGYGQVKAVIERLPSWEDVLFEVCRTTVSGVNRQVPSSVRLG